MRRSNPRWLTDKLNAAGRSGTLDLSGEILDDLSAIRSSLSLKQLILSFTQFRTLESLPFQPNLDSLLLDSSELKNFKNFRAIPKLSAITLKNTPASRHPRFKLSLVIVVGPSLRSITGQQVSGQLRQKAAHSPPAAADLVNLGWLAEWPVPSTARFEELAREWAEAQEPQTVVAPIDVSSEVTPPSSPPRQSPLAVKIQARLETYGYAIDPESPIESIMDILRELLVATPVVDRQSARSGDSEEPLPRSPDAFARDEEEEA
jgi:hypothetical protein